MIGPNVGDDSFYNEAWDDGYQAGVIEGQSLAPMFNGYLSEMRRDQREVFGNDFTTMSHDELKRELVGHAYAAVEELAELMQELVWKPWKQSEGSIVRGDLDDVAGEAADLFHFVAHILNIAGVTDERLNDAMQNARHKNRERQQNGYSYVAEQPRA